MSLLALDPWQIEESDFPVNGTTTEKLKFLLNYAVLAPSGHNTQPWFFKIEEDVIELYADRTRTLPIVDPRNRELIISCGAALFYLRLAILHFGYEDIVEYSKIFSPSKNPHLLARISLGRRISTTGEHHFLFRAIQKKHTYSHPLLARQIPLSLILELETAACAEYCWLEIVPEKMLQTVINLIIKGDRLQKTDPLFSFELDRWSHSSKSFSHNGISAYPQEINESLDEIAPLISFTINSLDLKKIQPHQECKLAETAPILAVLSTNSNTHQDWLAVGQALARVLLQANGNGIQASFLNQPIEISNLRLQLQNILKTESCPQILLHIGFEKDTHPKPKRTLEDVLLTTNYCAGSLQSRMAVI